MLECAIDSGWIQFVDFMQSKCSRAEFDNWIAPIQMISSSSEEIILEVPNVFVQEYLLDNYKEILSEFTPKKTNGDLAIVFQIQEHVPLKKTSVIVELPQTSQNPSSEIKLNSAYTFETFIEGPSNQFVKSAALGVATKPGASYNPLFIHGGVGLGKTHLLHSIGHYVSDHHKKLKIQAITTEAFINDIVDSLRMKSIDRMKKFYRNLDVLLIDDIQFLQNRLNFEEEFCNTFEILIHQGKQIVITSDKPPSHLKLSERTIGRMECGLVAHMSVPDLETRVAIIQQKAEEKHLPISYEVSFFIAEHIYNNVRQLEGAINRLCAYTKFQGSTLTVDAVEKILNELLQGVPNNKVTVEAILESVASVFHVRLADLRSDSRQKDIALARQAAMYLAKEMIDDSLAKIASSFGGKTHSTVLHAYKKIKELLQEQEQLRRQIQATRKHLEQI